MSGIKNLWRTKVFEILSIIIAFIAILVTIGTQIAVDYSTKKPMLQIELITLPEEDYRGYKITNVGYGPAVIEHFKNL